MTRTGVRRIIKSDAITIIRDALDIDLGLTVWALVTMAYESIWTAFIILDRIFTYVQCICTTYAEGQ